MTIRKTISQGVPVHSKYGVLCKDHDGIFLTKFPLEIKFKDESSAELYVIGNGDIDGIEEVSLYMGNETWQVIYKSKTHTNEKSY